MTPNEDTEQKAFINHCKINKITHFAPINETPYRRFMSPKEFGKMEDNFKKMGKVKGVNDVFVYLPNILLHLEFKRRDGKGKQSKEQIRWQDKVNKFSYCKYFIVNSYEEAIKVVEEYEL